MADAIWFAPKRFGYGAGLPVRWQGWALVLGYTAFAGAVATLLAPHHRTAMIVVLAITSVPFCIIAARHTRGGWRWRWGSDG